MSENAKKAGLIVVIVVALVAAVFGATKLFGGEKMEVQNSVQMPAGFKSEKERALEEQKSGGGGAAAGGGVKGGPDRDLGGDLGGG